MKFPLAPMVPMAPLATFLAAFVLTVVPTARAGQKGRQTPSGAAPAASAASESHPLQSPGKVGKSTYDWTNGWAWMKLSDGAKVAMVVGIEQGIVLSVRENWDAVQKSDQPALVKTAVRLTVNGVPFNQVVLDITKLYLDPHNDVIPVVDAYAYVVLELKKTPKNQLRKLLDRLRKTYPPPLEMQPMTPMGNPSNVP